MYFKKQILIYGALSLFLFSCEKKEQVDILIQNAWVFDGTGADSVKVDVGITNDRISFIGKNDQKKLDAKEIIDATGLYLAPGFIDPHTHTEADLSHTERERRANLAYLMQGVTTVFAGNDGSSPFPIQNQLESWDSLGIGTNAALFVGQGTIRGAVLGNNDVPASPADLDKMRDMVKQAMIEGSFGLSTGLFYAPGSFADTEEVIELAKVAEASGGIYDTHMREQSTFVLEGVQETIDIGNKAEIPVHISHIKVDGPVVWGKSDEVINLMAKARKSGVNISANVYPYLASRTSLKARLVPRWAEDGGNEKMLKRFKDEATLKKISSEMEAIIEERGGADKVVLSFPDNEELHNVSVLEIAKRWEMTPVEAVIKILQETPHVSAHSFVMQESDMLNFLKQPEVVIGSDGRTGGHPRTYGSFPKVIREYVLDRNILSMAEAIYKSTGLTAELVKLKDRGLIKEGFYADVILFNPQTITDNATYEKPNLLSSGMEYVWVNGIPTIEAGEFTGNLPGKALRSNSQQKK